MVKYIGVYIYRKKMHARVETLHVFKIVGEMCYKAETLHVFLVPFESIVQIFLIFLSQLKLNFLCGKSPVRLQSVQVQREFAIGPFRTPCFCSKKNLSLVVSFLIILPSNQHYNDKNQTMMLP